MKGICMHLLLYSNYSMINVMLCALLNMIEFFFSLFYMESNIVNAHKTNIQTYILVTLHSFYFSLLIFLQFFRQFRNAEVKLNAVQ